MKVKKILPNLSVSILKTFDFTLQESIDVIKNSNSMVHLDVMDGIFVDNISYQDEDRLKIIKDSDSKLDIHLMVQDVVFYIKKFISYKPKIITHHYELKINDSLEQEIISILDKNNILKGISISPQTNINEILHKIHKYDIVLIMSVVPGKGGQTFISETINRIKKIKNYIIENNLNTLIQIDGGINNESMKTIDKNLVDIFVCGSYIFENKNKINEKFSLFL